MQDYKSRLAQAQRHADIALEVLAIKADALNRLATQMDLDVFDQAVEHILQIRGRLVVSGVGKSGLVGRKISATLASTGTPSFFMHPTEAFHGDLGMLKPIDTMLLISYSGETEELLKLLTPLKHLGVTIVALTGRPDSTLAQFADYHLNIAVEFEACPNNLAPTTSTTATIAMGDALAVALAKARNFQPEDFALRHPGGSLGKMLLARVQDYMCSKDLPVCAPATPLRDVISIITAGRKGLCAVLDHGTFQGLITDGDLRRALTKTLDLASVTARDVMTLNPRTIAPSARLSDARDMMHRNRIKSLLVTDNANELVGVVDLYSGQ